MASEQCPACGAQIRVSPGQAALKCAYCGTQWSRAGDACPACGAGVDDDMEVCGNCGEPLGTVSRVLDRLDPLATRRHMTRTRQAAEHLRAVDDLASRRRISEFKEIDRRRELTYRAAQEAERQREKRTLWIAVGISAAIILLVSVVVVIVSS